MARLKGIDAIVGDRLRKLREANGFSRERLAERAGRSPSFLAKLELGTGRGRLETWERLAHALGCSLSDLFVEPAQSTSARETTGHYRRVTPTHRDNQLSVLAGHSRTLDSESLTAVITIVRRLARLPR